MTRTDKWLTGFVVAAWVGIILCVASFAWGANPTLSVAVDSQGYATIKADLPKGTPYNFQALDLGGEKRLLLLAWVDGQRAKIAVYDYSFKDFQPGPTPDPDPIPPVPPDPLPTPVTLTVVIVEETADATVDFAQIRNSKTLRDWAAKGGHTLFFLDKDSKDRTGKTPAGFKPWLDLAAGKPLPLAVIVDKKKNQVMDSVPVPKTESEFLAILQKWGGK